MSQKIYKKRSLEVSLIPLSHNKDLIIGLDMVIKKRRKGMMHKK
jgi:hypothetical protein